MTLKQRIYERIMTEIKPEKLVVKNQSHLHAGHAGDDGSGESHFKIEISANSLNDLSYVARERAVQKAITKEIQELHALTIKFVKD